MARRCQVSISSCPGSQEAHQVDLYPPSSGWILGAQVVPDTLSRGWAWSGGAKFKFLAFQEVRKSIKKTPIHHLQVGSLEDMWFLTHFLEVRHDQDWSGGAKFQFLAF